MNGSISPLSWSGYLSHSRPDEGVAACESCNKKKCLQHLEEKNLLFCRKGRGKKKRREGKPEF